MSDAFTFFRSYYEAAKELTDKQRLAFFDAIILYGIEGDETERTGIAKAMFSLVKPTIDKSKARATAGAKGGKNKTASSDEQASSKPQAKAKQTSSDISEDQDKDEDEDEDVGYRIPPVPPSPPSGEDGATLDDARGSSPFEQFWQAYPKKVGKQAALKAWKRIRPTVALCDQILQAVDAQKQCEQWRRENGRYIPNPVTWLCQGRWEDEADAAADAQAQTSNPFLALARELEGEGGGTCDPF